MSSRLVFLFDVDNTLLDNDRVSADLKLHLQKQVGHEGQQRYWAVFEDLRSELGYADYLGLFSDTGGNIPVTLIC